MIVREHALDQLESKRLVKVLELKELGTFAIPQKAKILEDGKCIARGGAKGLCRSVWKSYRFKFVGEHHAAIFLNDLVDDEHDQLAQRRRSRGRHHGRPRFVQFETQEQSLIHSRMPIHPSRQR